MTVRVDIAFAQPIDDEVRIRLLIATGALPEIRRCVISPDRRRATIYAADIAAGRVHLLAYNDHTPSMLNTSHGLPAPWPSIR